MIFHKLMNVKDHSKAKEYIFRFINMVIDEVREKNVVKVVMDNEQPLKL